MATSAEQLPQPAAAAGQSIREPRRHRLPSLSAKFGALFNRGRGQQEQQHQGRRGRGRRGKVEQRQEEGAGHGTETNGADQRSEVVADDEKGTTTTSEMPEADQTNREELEERGEVVEKGQKQKEKLNGEDGASRTLIQREAEEGELVQPVRVVAAADARQIAEGIDGTVGQQSAPEPKPRRGRRRSSVVHPLEEVKKAAEGGQRLNSRHSLSLQMQPSRPAPWLYVQTANRTFKRTTEAELQAEQRSRRHTSATNPLLLPEFATVALALCTQNVFHKLALILQGFVSGLAFGHTLFAFCFAKVNSTPTAESGSWTMDERGFMVVQAFFYGCLAITLVDALDRFELGPSSLSLRHILRHSLCSLGTLGVLCWFGAFIASVSSSQIDELSAKNDAATLKRGDNALFILWQLLSAVRAGFCLIGWLTSAIRPTANATRKEIEKMLQIEGGPLTSAAKKGMAEEQERGSTRKKNGEPRGDDIGTAPGAQMA